MFEKLEKAIKKAKADKFMALGEDRRTTPEFREALEEALEDIKDYFGADSVTLFMRRDKENGTSQFLGSEGAGLEHMYSLFESILEKLTQVMDRPAINALKAAQDTTEGGGMPPDKVAKALHIATQGLPSDVKKKVMDNIKKELKKQVGDDDVDDDEDNLLDEMLK